MFISNPKRFDQYQDGELLSSNSGKLIATSNIKDAINKADYILNWNALKSAETIVGESSLYILIKALINMKVNNVILVGLMEHFGFDKYFTSICGADNENKLKKIDILKNCKNELNAKKEETILVGDSYHDGAAARELGVGFIGVTYGFGFKNKKEIEEYKPLLSANKVSEIIRYFR